jgi:hypothetical protein
VADCFYLYQKEAHFVERDLESGEIVDGWPIGNPVEQPQHKCMSERMERAREFCTATGIDPSRVLVDPFEGDPFETAYGSWPDQLFCFSQGSVVFRGSLGPDGSRPVLFSQQLCDEMGW